MVPGPATSTRISKPRKQRRGGGGSAGPLFDPSTTLTGRKLKRASKKLTALELVPALRAYGRQANILEAQRKGAEAGLYDLGNRTSGKVAGAYGALQGSSDQTVARQQALQSMLNQDTSRVNNEAAANLTGQQTGQLGGITEALSARNVDPGGSASQAALAQQAQAQQQTAARNAESRGAFASAQGGSFTGLATGQAHAGQMRGAEAQTDIANLIAERIAESNQDHRGQIAEVLGKRADTKALWGPTRIKNLLQLRGSEREWMGQQASTAIDAQRLAETMRHNKAGEATSQGTLAASLRRIHDDLRHDRITEAQAQQRIRQARKRLKQSGGQGARP